ncbi:two component, sigma54 specific, transcriptional regulator, Fis family [Desulfarculus baarsii DSM 2075]|uniref:Two component, sigma54 specific, transcriptional regulator, Fis family n=1 Tax=Desulfarculus baarsii (strain ATCC 33931 / DSM 2075 / LMG 7858 / VKM B-1802 / 2st14) TaxID=644282 RepID=E1QH78_DESB2|nr:sigma-54 dependent transcriptional regulator [Desulfarculus baarsii]ADK84921.1 two component, sigma54 specific, transcriptional regulator, Fis family [Desulfarculus baarsii DSM 2075]
MTETGEKNLALGVLVVDDEANIRKTVSYCLSDQGHRVVAVGNAADALEQARRRSFDLAFVDLRLGAENGMALIPALLADSPWVKIVVITAHASIESVVEAVKLGAADYLAKPFTPDQLRLVAGRMGQLRRMESELAALQADARGRGPEARLQSRSAGMQRLIETARKAADSEAIVLLCGESGTGKSVFAKAIHRWSPRAAKPMGVVACPAMPADLLESELFGHAKGAFTGAVRDNPGRIAACEGGTLFLDEIGDMAPTVQAKLLRFIQDKEYERLGESKARKADVRIVAATNADLEGRVADGRFREDLFYRLNVICLTIPPLRQRPEDIMPLAADFLAHFCRANHKAISGFSPRAEQALIGHAWPGNVRQLRNAIERAVILGGGALVDLADLPGDIAPDIGAPAIGDRAPLALIEELHIRGVLANTASLQEAAEVLGIDQATLWRRRKAYGV